MKKNIKVFFIDLDGTSLDFKKNVSKTFSEKNLKAINDKKKEGIRFVVSTGRINKTLEKYKDMFKGEYVIGGNGAVIYDPSGKKIQDLYLSVRSVLLVLDIARKNKLTFKHSDSYTVYGAKTFLGTYIAKKAGFNINPSYSFEMHKKRNKIIIWGSMCKRKIQKVVDQINNEIDEAIAVTSNNGYSIEITNKEATKGLADEKVAKLIGVNKKNTAHIGDTMNDSTAIGKVGTFIAMKNSENKLKKMAGYIGPHYKNGGLAKILKGKYKKTK